MENLSKFKIEAYYSTPSGIKFTIFKYGKLIIIEACSYNIQSLEYGIQYAKKLPYDLYDTMSSITGNFGSSGQFYLSNNNIVVESTHNVNTLKNTVMGQLITFEK